MKQKIINITAIIILLALIVLLIVCNKATANEDATGEIATRINKLRDDKMQCLDSLSYIDSIKHAQGKEKFCYENDDEIMKLQEELDRLMNKDYMNVGLIME